MHILTVSGSASMTSSNALLLKALARMRTDHFFEHCHDLSSLPTYSPDLDRHPLPDHVMAWRSQLTQADALVISTPAYLNNIPSILKNALEWIATSGEMRGKAVLALTYTPHPPRGKEAMQSLLWSLQALDARIVAQCPLYQSELVITKEGVLSGDMSKSLLEEAISLLNS